MTNCDLYNPTAGTWTAAGLLKTSREHHTAALLPNGKVLVMAGDNEGGTLGSCELYDPVANSWSFTGSLISARREHRSATLFDGKVLVGGGYGVSYYTTTEAYDSAVGIWTNSGTMITFRVDPSMTPMLNGKLLIAGGWFNNGPSTYQTSAETYDAGLGFTGAARPIISTVPSNFVISNAFQVTGSQFRGVSQTAGYGGISSPSDFPLVQLRSFENEQTAFLTPTNWSTNSFLSVPVTNFPLGNAMATVFANGIASTSSVVLVVPTGPGLVTPTMLGDRHAKLTFAGTAGLKLSYSVVGTTNLALAFTNWTIVGVATDSVATPGQFQFTDSQSTGLTKRFYRVQWP